MFLILILTFKSKKGLWWSKTDLKSTEGLPDSQIFIYDLKTFKVRQGLYVGEVYLLLPDYSYLVIFFFRRITFFIFLFLKFQLILPIFQIFR